MDGRRAGLIVWVASVALGCSSASTATQHAAEDGGIDAPFFIPPDDSSPIGAPLDAQVIGVEDTGVAPHTGHYPFVLVHGFAGFSQIGPVDYFFQVADDLRSRGETVYECEIAPFLPPPQRAPMLAAYVDMVLMQTGASRVNLIAHSQGGLDSRYLISTLGYGDRVASLVTVATPHRGTLVADLFEGLVPGDSAVLDAFVALLGFTYNQASTSADISATIQAMTQSAAVAFNAANPDDPRVLYWSYAGRSNERDGALECADSVLPNAPAQRDITNILLQPTVNYLEQGDPIHHVNDGLVEVQSAKWGVFMGCEPADHFSEVGQILKVGPDPISGFDHLVFYRDIVARLHAAGM